MFCFLMHHYETMTMKGEIYRVCRKCNKTYKHKERLITALSDTPERWVEIPRRKK